MTNALEHQDNQDNARKSVSGTHKRRLSAVRIQLRSSVSSDMWRGMHQIKQWLKEDPEDRDIYGLLLEAVQVNMSLREKVYDFLETMSANGSKTAADVLKYLPNTVRSIPSKVGFDNYSIDAGRIQAVRIQLRSTLPSDILRAMEQTKKWLQESPENWDIYALLLDAVQENSDLRESVQSLMEGMLERGSKAAIEAINGLPVSIQNLITDADNAYYAAEYEKAIQLYHKVLQLEPSNQQAQIQLAKAEANKVDAIRSKSKHLPREAIQFYRQARSYIAAKDIRSAVVFLQAAVEAANVKEVNFLEAEDLLNNMQSLFDTIEQYKDEKVPFKYDVFISYSHKDEDWVQKQLLPYLESKGIAVYIDFRDFEIGAPSLTEMERAVIQSHKTIVVLTPDYLISTWGEFENILVQSLDPAARDRTLLPILLRSCELPLRLRSLTYLDFTRSDRMKYQFDRLVSAVKARDLMRVSHSMEDKLSAPNIKKDILSKDITIVLERDILDFTPAEKNDLVFALSKILQINSDQIKVLRVIEGSVIVTLEMPEESAFLLLSLFSEKDSRLRELKITKLFLQSSADFQQPNQINDKAVFPNSFQDQEVEPKKIQSPIPRIFISYSHKDEGYKDELMKMLAPLQDQNVLNIWQDREIEPGDEWYKAIETAMSNCDLALLLISSDFLNSRFIKEIEVRRFLQRRKEEGLRVVPIIIRSCMWKSVPVLKDLQALPKNGKPVVSFTGLGKRDQVWEEIGKAIEEIAYSL